MTTINNGDEPKYTPSFFKCGKQPVADATKTNVKPPMAPHSVWTAEKYNEATFHYEREPQNNRVVRTLTDIDSDGLIDGECFNVYDEAGNLIQSKYVGYDKDGSVRGTEIIENKWDKDDISEATYNYYDKENYLKNSTTFVHENGALREVRRDVDGDGRIDEITMYDGSFNSETGTVTYNNPNDEVYRPSMDRMPPLE